ncbi:MAG: alpha/beta fold hydrolase [Gemmatimonadaceae bacterium]
MYWADVLYETPDTDPANYESSLEQNAEQVDGGGLAELPIAHTAAEAEFIEALRRQLTRATAAEVESGAAPMPEDPDAVGLERIPLPWFIKKRIMKAWLRDAHHYYFNERFSPRAGVSYAVQDEIRARFVSALGKVPQHNGPHVVVAHSMGTMVAYDCLKRVAACPSIDALVTLGSPLGIDEVQDCNKPEWSRADGFPSERIRSKWVNVYDRLDVICGADPHFADDFCQRGVEVIEDIAVTNDGAWRHAVAKYLRQPVLQATLRRLLGL